ncbi:MAG: CoA-binding protein [Rhodopseudomonas sp.]|nr:CoA-binding protein [Rhodopseudomonas sp.]
MTPLDRLMKPRSVAIIGASADIDKLTGRPLAYLEKLGYRDKIYLVNPRYRTIGDRPCYPDATSLPEAPDVAIVLVGASRVIETIGQLRAIGAGTAIVLASGFGESGEEGQRQQRALKEAAGPMRLLGPNTIGLINITDGIALSASAALVGADFVAGSIALISQSGGILGSLLSRAQAQGIGFSKLIATGNECDLGVADFIGYCANDAATKVIALYLEGLRDPAHFERAVIAARHAGKPVVAFKVGRSESGAQSAASHTGALAGSDAAYDALFKRLGIIRAERYSDLLDMPMALSCAPALAGRRLAVVTSTGGAASLLADAAGVAGFAMPAPDAATAARLKALDIAGATLDRNPIDVTLAGVKSDYFRTIIDSLIDSPSYDAIAVVLGSSALNNPETVGRPLREGAARSAKPVMGFVSPDAPDLVRRLNMAGVPTFASPEGCLVALDALWRSAQGSLPEAMAAPALPAVGADIQALLRPGPLNEAESKALFATFGVPVTREVAAPTAEAAETAATGFAGNVVVKVLSRDVLHKSEAGGVAVNVAPGDVADTCAKMATTFTQATGKSPEGFLVQELVAGGVELILGLKRDPQLGPAILLGAGGIAAELFKDTTLRLAPVSPGEARAMIDELKSAPLLKGYRGRPVADQAALVDAIVAFSTMALALGDRLVEAEINPLFVLPEGRGVVAADGVVIIATP